MTEKKELRIFSRRWYRTDEAGGVWRVGYSLDNEKLLFHDIRGEEAHTPSDDEILKALESAASVTLELIPPDDIKDSPAEAGKPVSDKPVPTATK